MAIYIFFLLDCNKGDQCRNGACPIAANGVGTCTCNAALGYILDATKPDMNECIKGCRSVTDCTMGSCDGGKCQCFRGFVLHPNNALECIRGGMLYAALST